MRPIDADFAKEKIKKSDLTNREKTALLLMISEIPTLDPTPNNPLTLSELREMGGYPVYVVPADGKYCPKWMIVDTESEVCRNPDRSTAAFDTLGEAWRAYRRKPEDGEAPC